MPADDLKNVVYKASFSNGIISHSVGVRTDWQKHETSVKEALNFMVTSSGAMTKRPGFEWLGESLYITDANGQVKPPRLMKFEFSLGQTYILEFGNNIMRFWFNGALIENLDGTPYTLETPYNYEQILVATGSQYKDTMTFTHWDMPIQILTRGPDLAGQAPHTNWWWTINYVDETDNVKAPTNVHLTHDGHNGVSYTVTTVRSNQESKGGNESVTTPTATPAPEPGGYPAQSSDQFQQMVNNVGWVQAYPSWASQWGINSFIDYNALAQLGSINGMNDYAPTTPTLPGAILATSTTLFGLVINPIIANVFRGVMGVDIYPYRVEIVKYNGKNQGAAISIGAYYKVGSTLYLFPFWSGSDYRLDDVVYNDVRYPPGFWAFQDWNKVSIGSIRDTPIPYQISLPPLIWVDKDGDGFRDFDELVPDPSYVAPGSVPETAQILMSQTGTSSYKIAKAATSSTFDWNGFSSTISSFLVNQVRNVGITQRGGYGVSKPSSIYSNIMSHKPPPPPPITVHNTIAWNAVAGATSYNVYRRTLVSDDPRYYLLQNVPASSTTFTDTDVENNQTNASKSPFTTGNYFDEPGTYPHTNTYYQQRLIVASTKQDPLMIGGSTPGFFWDFLESDNPLDVSGAWRFRLASKTSNPIKQLIPIKSLYVLTQAGAFVSTVSGAVTRANVNFNQEAYLGSSDVPAVIIENTAIYVPINGQQINTLRYSFTDDAFVDDNILFAAQDLLEDENVISMDFLRPTISLLTAATSGGKLLVCTFIPTQSFAAWAHWRTQGEVGYVCTNTTPEGVDECYCAIKRNNRYHIEKVFDLRVRQETPNMDNICFLDSSLQGRFANPVNQVNGLDHLNGNEVYALVDMSVQGPFEVTNGSITLDYPGTAIQVGLPYEAVLETLDINPSPSTGVPTLVGRKRKIYQASLIVEKAGDLTYQLNHGPEYEYIFQNEDSLGLPPRIFTGVVDLPGAVRNNDESTVRVVSRKPLPLTINAMAVKEVYV